MHSVSCSIKIKSQSEDIWKVISSHGNLNFFHPFCKKNKVEVWGVLMMAHLVYDKKKIDLNAGNSRISCI